MSSEAIFIHTADWQLGKPYASVADYEKRTQLSQQRIEAIHRLGEFATAHQAKFVLVAGDLFDTQSPKKQLVSAACKAIGDLQIPVYAIPGNHDYYGIESIWQQEFFLREQKQLAPNFHLLTESTPTPVPNAWLFPCPLLRRQTSSDPTNWLRTFAIDEFLTHNPDADQLPWIILAHGSTQGFESSQDDEDSTTASPNQIDLDRLPSQFDYVGLGDWHGMKCINDRAWYAGTHESDRFPKNEEYQSGYSLLVNARRRQAPVVTSLRTGKLRWHRIDFHFRDDDSLSNLQHQIQTCTSGRVGSDLVRLELTGTLGLAATQQLEELIETWNSRLLRVKNYNYTQIAPTENELNELAYRQDPLIARVAHRLNELRLTNSEQAAIANVALRQLFQLCRGLS